MLRSPLQRLQNEHVECSLQQLNSVFILVFLVHRCRHSTRSGSRLSTPSIMAAPQFKAVLIAAPQMRSESGLTFRSKQSAAWPAETKVFLWLCRSEPGDSEDASRPTGRRNYQQSRG